jgi:hypothetical protein
MSDEGSRLVWKAAAARSNAVGQDVLRLCNSLSTAPTRSRESSASIAPDIGAYRCAFVHESGGRRAVHSISEWRLPPGAMMIIPRRDLLATSCQISDLGIPTIGSISFRVTA